MQMTTTGVVSRPKVNVEELISRHAVEIARVITRHTETAASEEDVRQEFATLLRSFLNDAEITVRARHEYALAGGRIDTKYGGVILEYKNPNSADRIDTRVMAPATQRLINQIKTRFQNFESDERIEQKRLFGCGIDGRHILFVRNRTGKFEVDDPEPVTSIAVDRLLRALVSLGASGHSFTPESLTHDFGSASSVAQRAVTALYLAISHTTDPKARTLYDQWRLLFSEVCGYKVNEPNTAINVLAENFGLPNADSAMFLFALHTYYSIFIKLLGSEIVSAFSPFTTSIIQRCINSPSARALGRIFFDLEKGSNWKAWGVSNFLEGDLFAWYISAWTDEVAAALRAMAQKADEYDPSTLSVDPGESHDLLKVLYQNLIPRKIRHDLGEYYTPDWLASKVLDLVSYDGNPDTRILDPGCGSGTFLVEAINRIRQWFSHHRYDCGFSEEGLIQRILNNVVGFDLNPLAVMASRVNYLLVIRDLIKHASHVELPVYLSDSVLTPSAFGTLFANITQLKTAVGEFLIPAEVSRSSAYIAKYTEIMELCIEDGIGVDIFLHSCEDAGLPIENQPAHRQLYEKMRQLSIENRNGIWARVIKNSFAPIFAEKFDFVVGNPPWINWQHLPKDYRTDLLRVWNRYDLLTLTGAAAGLGGSKKDLSMLFTYVSADQYLVEQGRLGFLITQSVFKTHGAGDGFRRFRYEGNDRRTMYLHPIEVGDLSAIQVFEGATNRTALMVLQKSRKRFSYPVPYRIWKGTGRIPQSANFTEITGRITVHDAVAEPVIRGRSTAPWLTVPAGTLQACQRTLGKGAYRAMAGCTTWLNGVYWIEVLEDFGKQAVIENLHTIGKTKGIYKIQERIETALIFRLIRGEDVFRWRASPSLQMIMPQDPVLREGIPELEMQRKYRLTYNYLKKFEDPLRNRSGYRKYFKSRGPFYSIYNVNTTTFSQHKVVWRDMGSTMQTAVVSGSVEERGAIPEHHVMYIPTKTAEEAHFICGVLNSSPVCLTVAGYTTNTGMSTHVASTIGLPRFSARTPTHRRIAELSQECHAHALEHRALSRLEQELDDAVSEIFSISAQELKLIRDGLMLF